VTLTALGEIFGAARVIMGWLGDCAKVWSHSHVKLQMILKSYWFWHCCVCACMFSSFLSIPEWWDLKIFIGDYF